MVRNVTARVVGLCNRPVRTEPVLQQAQDDRSSARVPAEVVLLRPIPLPLLLAKLRETLG